MRKFGIGCGGGKVGEGRVAGWGRGGEGGAKRLVGNRRRNI